MMRFLMSYRLVILNGEKRGERLDIGRAPLTIGKGASCDIQLPDPQAEERHAHLTPLPDELRITAIDHSHPLRINNATTHESLLKQGDVIEIGATRLFIQFQVETDKWNGLAGLRSWRKGLTIGLPLLILTGLALTLNHYRHQTGTSPAPAPAPARTHSRAGTDPDNTDWLVTNVERIVIHPTVFLTSTPPDIAEAAALFKETRTEAIDQEIEAAHEILRFATEFLAEARKLDSQTNPIPESPSSATLLEEAEVSMGLTPARTDSSNNTLPLSQSVTNEAPPNQAGSLEN